MLVLSRKHQESVVVSGADGYHRLLKVTVLGVQGDNVKLGFEVDPDVSVRRLEPRERINVRGQLSEVESDGLLGRIRSCEGDNV